jgi:chromate reductase, NAD(P)H dehydrogenase (quinone)
MPANILVFAGSSRRDSYNRKLARVAAEAVNGTGGRATLLELADHPLSLYNADLEAAEGLPESALRLKEAFISHAGLLIVSPEYNGSIPPLLKNTLDWVSRPLPHQNGYLPFQGKPAVLMSASPGALGGQRALRHVRDVLIVLRMLVLPETVSLSHADQAFDQAGRLKDAGVTGRVADLAKELVRLTGRLGAEQIGQIEADKPERPGLD